MSESSGRFVNQDEFRTCPTFPFNVTAVGFTLAIHQLGVLHVAGLRPGPQILQRLGCGDGATGVSIRAMSAPPVALQRPASQARLFSNKSVDHLSEHCRGNGLCLPRELANIRVGCVTLFPQLVSERAGLTSPPNCRMHTRRTSDQGPQER